MVLSGIRPSFPSLSRSAGQITHVLLTRSPLEHPHHKSNAGLSVRLACVKHAASVRPEPGSNSPKKQTKNYRQKTKKSTKQKQTTNTIIHVHVHVRVQTIKFVSSNDTLSSSQTTPPPTTQTQNQVRAVNSDHTNIQTPPQNHKPPPHNNKNREKLYKVC